VIGSDRKRLAVLLLVALALRLGWGMAQPGDEAAVGRLPDVR
jgi:hypothetical protein